VLWVLEASGRAPFQTRDGPRHVVRASTWVRAYTDVGPVVRSTFLIEADASAGADLEALVPTGSHTWDVEVKPAPDGTYPDLERRQAVVVRDGTVVSTRHR
jgi:hypothetical protein